MARPKRPAPAIAGSPPALPPALSGADTVAHTVSNGKGDRKHVAFDLAPDAAKHIRLFRAHMDWTQAEIVEYALRSLHRQFPDYEIRQ